MKKNKNHYGKPSKKPNENPNKDLPQIINDTGQVASQWSQEHGSVDPPKEMRLQLAKEAGFFLGGLDQFNPDGYVGMPYGSEGHTIVVGSSGSGKSMGIVKPTLTTWGGTICAIDIKGELSEYYKAFSDALLRNGILARPYIIFAPTEVDGPAYDPFWWLQQDSETNLVSNIDEIALAIIPPLVNDREPFWRDTERVLLSAALLYYYKAGLSFSETICRIMDLNCSSLCEELSESGDTCVKMRLGQLADADHIDPKMLGSITVGLHEKITLFATDPHISHAFRGEREGAECFNWDDLNKYHIFLRVPDDRVEPWGRAITLMYTQLIRHLGRRPEMHSPEGANNVQTLLLMDEIARCGKLEIITAAMATLRSKNVNICLIIQSLAQLDEVYGEKVRRILFDNTKYTAILGANDPETQKWLAEKIGTRIHFRPSVGKQLDVYKEVTGYSMQLSETQDWIVYPHKLSTLKDVLLLSPDGFCRLKKLRPEDDLQWQLVSSIYRLHRAFQKEEHVSLDDPIDLDILDIPGEAAKVNEGARMLTIDERTARAKERVEKAQRQMSPVMMEELTAVDESNRSISSAIGDLLLRYFPEIYDLETGYKRGDEGWSEPLEKILSALTDDQQMVESMKRKANWLPPGTADV